MINIHYPYFKRNKIGIHKPYGPYKLYELYKLFHFYIINKTKTSINSEPNRIT